MILKDVPVYNGDVIHSRFAYKFFKDKVLPIGNVIAFRAPMDVTVNLIDLEDKMANDFIWSDDAINFIWEIPILDNRFGAVAFQRLFCRQVADILHKYIKKPIEVEGDDLMVCAEFTQGGITQLKGKASVSITHVKDGAALGHLAINVVAGKKAPAFAYSTNLSDEQCEQFMQDVISMFYETCDSLFVATTKVQL